MEQKFSDKDIALEMEVDREIHVLAEETSLINSVLNNILTNAVKFSFKGSRIVIRARKQGDRVAVSFRDFGVGMPPSLVAEIFDVRKATHRAGTQGETGTGFGMPLLKRFVDAYDGQVEILSKEQAAPIEERGTEIVLSLKMD